MLRAGARTAPAPTPAPAAAAADPTAELERLAQLHQSGVLSDEALRREGRGPGHPSPATRLITSRSGSTMAEQARRDRFERVLAATASAEGEGLAEILDDD